MRFRHGLTPLLLVALFVLPACTSTPDSTDGDINEAVQKYKRGVDQEYLANGNLDSAIRLLKEALELEPTYTLCRRDLGRMLMERGLKTLTKKHLLLRRVDQIQKEIDSNVPDDQAAELRSQSEGYKLEARKLEDELRIDLGEAWDHLARVRRERPEDPTIPYYLGFVCTGLERYEEARDYYYESLEIGDTDEHGRKAILNAIEELEDAIAQRDNLELKD